MWTAIIGKEFESHVLDSGGDILADNLTQHQARLIAAAPEMLETLKDALEDLKSAEVHVWDEEHPASPDDCRYCCTSKRIEAAIAKAEGR